jgi:hypothetical protein
MSARNAKPDFQKQLANLPTKKYTTLVQIKNGMLAYVEPKKDPARPRDVIPYQYLLNIVAGENKPIIFEFMADSALIRDAKVVVLDGLATVTLGKRTLVSVKSSKNSGKPHSEGTI